MRLGPQSGARDGKRDYKAASNVPRGKTGSNWKAEEKQRKADEAKAKRLEKRAAKQAEKKGWFS